MKIPMKKQKPMIDFNPFMDALEEKYDFKYRDMMRKYKWIKETQERLCAEHGIDYEVWGKRSPLEMDKKSLVFKDIYDSEMKRQPPYRDGWHYFLENDFSELRRGGANYMYFVYDEESGTVLFEDNVPDWIQPLYQAIFNEVKDHEAFDGESVTFHIDW